MIKPSALLLLLSLFTLSCGEKSTDPEPEDPGQSRVLFVHAMPDVDSIEFQGQPLQGARLVTFIPGSIGFSGISRYLAVSALPVELRAISPETDEVYVRDTLNPEPGASYSLFGFADRTGEQTTLIARDILTRDSLKRPLVRGINLIPEIDSLRLTFLDDGSVGTEVGVYPFGTGNSPWVPLFDSVTTTLTLQADILDAGAPGGFENLYTGKVTLRPGAIYTFAAIGRRATPQIIILSHLDL